MGSPYSNLNNYPGCDSANTRGAESVRRGGQGGACAPPGEEDLYRREAE